MRTGDRFRRSWSRTLFRLQQSQRYAARRCVLAVHGGVDFTQPVFAGGWGWGPRVGWEFPALCSGW
eukprot:2963328-Pyramimonas_sp.AAC.1